MAETFRKRAGTTNKGTEYKVLNIANVVMNLVSDDQIKDFRISSNDEEYGPFEVIEADQENGTEIFALQLKHNGRGNLTLKQLTRATGDFSIQGYFHSLKFVKNPNVKLILYTNLQLNVEKDTKFYLAGENFPVTLAKVDSNSTSKILPNTGSCYKFSIVRDDNHEKSEKVSLYEKFFEIFCLYSDQENLHNLKIKINEKFKTLFCGNEAECDEYLKFLNEWSLKEGVKVKLSKNLMKVAIALKIFSSRIKPMSFRHSNKDVKPNIGNIYILRKNILREAIEAFDITTFRKNSYDEVKTLWDDAACDLTDLKLINDLRTNYQLASTYISDVAKVDPLILSILLWLMGKRPLILNQDSSVNKALQLCVGKKIILLKEDHTNSENISAFQTLADLKVKTFQFNRLIPNFRCSLQGKWDVPLEKLIPGKEEMLTVLKTDDLLEMLRGECIIGEEIENLPEPYVARSLLKNPIDVKILDDVPEDAVVLLDSVTQRRQLENRLKKYNLINIGDDFNAKGEKVSQRVLPTSNTTIYLSDEPCQYSEFDAICNEFQNIKQFHHLRVRDADEEDLKWIRTKGDISAIHRFRSPECYRVNGIPTHSPYFKNNVNLLCSDPGTGKSVFIKTLKMKSFLKYFTVIFHPSDVYSFLKTAPHPNDCVDAFQNFLLNEKYKTLSARDKAIIRIFLKRNKAVYVWEALDELSDDNRNIVTNIIVELSKTCVQWVTSRCHLRNTLQRKFKVIALNLNPLEDDEQRSYIRQRLAGLSPVDVEVIIKQIETSWALVEHKGILGIPLQVFMLTDLLRQNRRKYCALLKNIFTLTDLYRCFIDEKFNILCREKFGTGRKSPKKVLESHKDKLLVEHTNAALRLLFPEATLAELVVPNRESDQWIQETGLVSEIKDQIPRFFHNSFAEYLAARYFANNLQHTKMVQEFLFEERYTNVRFFFDLILARHSQPHLAILYKNFKYINSCDSDVLRSTDSGGRTLLHLACSWGQRYPELPVKYQFIRGTYTVDHEDLFETVQESKEYLKTLDLLLKKCEVWKPDEIFKMTPREFAQRSTCLVAEMRVLMQQPITNSIPTNRIINMLYHSACGGYYQEFTFFFQLLKSRTIFRKVVDSVKNRKGITLLSVTILLGHEEIVKFLLTEGADVNLATGSGLNSLITAAAKGNYTIVEFFIREGADINLEDEYGDTSLNLAASNGHYNVVEVLVRAGADVNCSNKNCDTPLLLASLNGHYDVVEFLINAGADMNFTDEDGCTPLHLAVSNGHYFVVKVLVEAGADLNRSNTNGETPLILASLNGYYHFVNLLIKAGADISCRDKDGYNLTDLAGSNGHYEVVDLLARAGVDVD